MDGPPGWSESVLGPCAAFVLAERECELTNLSERVRRIVSEEARRDGAAPTSGRDEGNRPPARLLVFDRSGRVSWRVRLFAERDLGGVCSNLRRSGPPLRESISQPAGAPAQQSI